MLNFHKSLPVRVGKIIAIFSVSLVACYTVLLTMLYAWGSAKATHSVLLHETHQFLQAYAKDPSIPLPMSQSLQGYIGINTLPSHVTEAFPPERWNTIYKTPEGILYTPRHYENGEGHRHLQISDLPDRDEKFYLYYEIIVPYTFIDRIKERFRILAFIGAVIVALMLMVFHRVIQRALMPIGALSDWVQCNHKSEEDLNPLPASIQDDEIGELANTLYTALDRIHHQNDHERQFLRNASHELRTPIAIIRNSMDVLEHFKKKDKLKPEKLNELHLRMRRASDTMKAVTEAILWLAQAEKGNTNAPIKKETDISALVENLVAENRNLIQGRPVSVEIDITDLQPKTIETSLLHIALDNLIRNAFQHANEGTVRISSESPDSITIANANPTYDCSQSCDKNTQLTVDRGGFGLGLALVKKIAQTQNWQFSFTIDDQAIAKLNF